MADLYDQLNIDRSATPEQVRQSYLTMSRMLHPDKSTTGDTSEAFRQVHAAYRVLSDPTLKSFYDKYGNEGIALAEEVFNPDDMKLIPSDQRLAELERKVRNLVRSTCELKAQQQLNLTGESSYGARVISLRPLRYRWNASSLAQSVSFTTGNHQFTLATAAHVQRAGGGVHRLSCHYGYQLNHLTILRLSSQFLGRGFGVEAGVERKLDDWNTGKFTVSATRGNLEAHTEWKHRISSMVSGAIGLRFGSTEGVSVELSKKPGRGFLQFLRLKLRLEVTSDDCAVQLKVKGKPTDKMECSIGPSLSTSAGANVELQCVQQIEAPVEALAGAFPTAVTCTLNLPLILDSLTFTLRLSRGGLGFSLPLEFDVPRDSRLTAVFAAVSCWALFPLSSLMIRKVRPAIAPYHEESEPRESFHRQAAERRAEEEAKGGLVILSASFEDGPDVTDQLQSRVLNSTLQLSDAPKYLLFGERARGKLLIIKYKIGDTTDTRSFGESEVVLIP